MNVIQKLCKLRPSSWKSDPQLNHKQTDRYDVKSAHPNEKSNNITRTQPLSKSSDWTEVDLEVPEKDEHIHLRNPQLSIIFSKENGTPTPPPRKPKKNFREKIEAVAKNSFQAFQTKKPAEEPICVKKTINYKCPLCDEDQRNHNRDHHHPHHHHDHDNQNNDKKNDGKREGKQSPVKSSDKKSNKEQKRRKNLSVVSLPNYNELKLTVAHFDDIDKTDGEKSNNSLVSLPIEGKKAAAGSTGRLDNYITRCRSFGSLLPQQLKKLRARKAPADVESDDSFGALEDWDLGLIEHYNPKDASLPRPRKVQRNSKDAMADIENLIVTEEDLEKVKPKPPVRRSESLVKKINREGAESALKRSKDALAEPLVQRTESKSVTPPPSPTLEPEPQERLFISNLPTQEDGKVEHSSLMRILEQFSIRDKQGADADLNDNNVRHDESSTKNNSNQSSLTPSLLEFEKNINTNPVEEFIAAEKLNTEKDLNFAKQTPTAVS
ncbi:uncharacterized protein LOC108907490 isoform X2 [Anoplophora glabripennis]|uniref:uncharacterized protein LOC108907490 isoform X2 n=1 Tax=Anoplophora glabripennis TaxID=217634 RepID=UPI000874EFFF|nr:uncharacterized protein LOC108907490 isoform X2 [Anoplophora glabripennis]